MASSAEEEADVAQIDWNQLCEDAAQYLDGDHRYWSEDEGAFTWGAVRVWFEKTRDSIILTVEGETRECGRP